MQFDTNRHGRGSVKGSSPALLEAWKVASGMDHSKGEWVPVASIWIRDGVSPRVVNHEAVERYAECFHDLPAIEVQRGTFALIDGRHRLEAAARASSDFIRIVEVDVDDDSLALRAFEANLAHGLAYTTAERVHGLKLMIAAHPDWSIGKLAASVGLSYDTVHKHHRSYVQSEHTEIRYVQPAHSAKRVGADGVARSVPSQSIEKQAIQRVRDARDIRREPVSEPAWEEPARQVEESPAESAARKLDALGARPGYAPVEEEEAPEFEDAAVVSTGAVAPGGTSPALAAFPFEHWLGKLMALPSLLPVPEGGTEREIAYAVGVLEQLSADCGEALQALRVAVLA